MPRSPLSLADQELLAAAAAAGQVVTPFQLERWRRQGLVPRNSRRGLGRGRGTVSTVPDDALPRLLTVARSARQGQRLIGGAVFLRLASGQPVTDKELRAALLQCLRSLSRRFGLDEPGDFGWQTRYNRARAVRLGSASNVLDMVLNDGDIVPTEADGDNLSVVAWVQALAGDVDGVDCEDLVQAMAASAGWPQADVEGVMSEIRAIETEGKDLVSILVSEMSIPVLLERVESADAVTLRRAVTAVQLIQVYHGVLVFQCLNQIAHRATDHAVFDQLPPSLIRIPDGINRLASHPAYRWLSNIGLPHQQSDTLVALIAMTLVNQPEIFEAVDDYRIQLVDIMSNLGPP